VGQFTELFNGLENAEPKSQRKAKADNTAKRSPEKQTTAAAKEAPAKALPSSKSKPKSKEGNGNAAIAIAAPVRGKRSHPDYTQAPAFVRKDTYKAIKIALLNDDRGLDYSDLVQELLTAWLSDRK
jgi:hypothetical protein